jgi:hypothetical protein
MKQGVLLFLLAILLGCTSNKRVDNSPIAEGTDSVMVVKAPIKREQSDAGIRSAEREEARPKVNGHDEVELFKTRTGHITATLSVNGKPCIFLIDTGGGATLIDKSKKYKFGLEASKTGDYAAGIGSVSALTKTSATLQINGYEIEEKDLYLMDISYINSEFRKNHARQVDGVLGTDFLDKYKAVMLSFVVPDLNVYAVGLQL